MSDDLVKRLRDWSEYDEGKINDAREEAADRIEQLEAALRDALTPDMVAREIAVGLWDLLDEIDTIGDLAKDNDKLYRKLVEKVQRRRFSFGSTDGYSVSFSATPPARAALEGKKNER